MIEELIHNEKFRRWFPPVAALALIALFVSLGMWQLDRAAEKNAVKAMFEDDAPYTQVSGNVSVTEYQNIEARGRYLGERQIIIDNIILDGRLGAYIITPFEYSQRDPLLIVNRGWIAKDEIEDALPDLAPNPGSRSIRGRAGHLPRVGVRSGGAFTETDGWPRRAVYPTLGELAGELGNELLPFVLLLDPQENDGFLRRWQPRERGPTMHYGYALQWFAMAAAVLGFTAWRMRKKPA